MTVRRYAAALRRDLTRLGRIDRAGIALTLAIAPLFWLGTHLRTTARCDECGERWGRTLLVRHKWLDHGDQG